MPQSLASRLEHLERLRGARPSKLLAADIEAAEQWRRFLRGEAAEAPASGRSHAGGPTLPNAAELRAQIRASPIAQADQSSAIASPHVVALHDEQRPMPPDRLAPYRGRTPVRPEDLASVGHA